MIVRMSSSVRSAMMIEVSADKPPERFCQLWNGLALTGGTCENVLPPGRSPCVVTSSYWWFARQVLLAVMHLAGHN